MKYIVILILAVIGSSCVTQKKCNQKFPCSQTDSIMVVTKTKLAVRDTTIYIEIPGKTEIKEIPVYVDRGIVNSDKSVIENEYCISTAWVDNGILKHNLTLKKQSIPQTIPGAIKETAIIKTEKEVQKVPVHYVNSWENFQIWVGRILALIFALWVGYKLIRFYLKRP